jgi:hypothetical protein
LSEAGDAGALKRAHLPLPSPAGFGRNGQVVPL